MAISIQVNEKRIKGRRSPMLYGHFIEHFHRQIYNGIYDPQNPLSDEDGLRSDILSAMRQIKVPVLRWPGGCVRICVFRDRKTQILTHIISHAADKGACSALAGRLFCILLPLEGRSREKTSALL